MPDAGQSHDSSRVIFSGGAGFFSSGRALDHQGHEEVGEEEVPEVVGGHVQLQVFLRHVFLGQGYAGV